MAPLAFMHHSLLPALLFISGVSAAAPTVTAKLVLFVETGPVGSGPEPCSVALSGHGSANTPTAILAQYLNEPIGVQAFNSTGGGSPVWSLWPESVDTDLTWEIAGTRLAGPPASSSVDTVLLQYSNHLFSSAAAPCVFSGWATVGAQSQTGTPLWTQTEPAPCAPTYQPENDWFGLWRSIEFTPDGSILLASFVAADGPVIVGYNALTGRQMWRTPLGGASYGVMPSANGAWVLTTADGTPQRNATVFSVTTGKQRGSTSCEMSWNNPPAISPDGGYVMTGDQNGMWLCAWNDAANAYAQVANIAIPAKGETYWFPVSFSIITANGTDGQLHTYGGATFVGDSYSTKGRFYAVDLDIAASGSLDYIVADAILESDAHNIDNALLRAAGPYWVVGAVGGDTNATGATEFLFAPGTPASPALAPLWSFTGGGEINNIDAIFTPGAGQGAGVIHVAAAGAGETSGGGTGNGGQMYWHQLTVKP